MDKNTLLIFAQRIFNSGSVTKAILSLKQLKSLLEVQGAQQEELDLLDKMIDSAVDMSKIAKKDVLTELDVEIAKRRTDERRAREEAARFRGRC